VTGLSKTKSASFYMTVIISRDLISDSPKINSDFYKFSKEQQFTLLD
jgi:hypothetical protein